MVCRQFVDTVVLYCCLRVGSSFLFSGAEGAVPESAEYTSFLVRLWCEPDQEQPEAVANWQGEVEHIQSGQRRTFDTLDEALGFLRRQTVAPDEVSQTPDEREQATPGSGAHGSLPLLAGLLDMLDLLTSQARAYERALPPDNYPALAAVATLGELARQALTEAHDLVAALEPNPPAQHPLSPRELEVLTLAAEGLTNKEIAYRLGISERTVQFHMNSVFNKTATQSRTEAVALGLRQGWLTCGFGGCGMRMVRLY